MKKILVIIFVLFTFVSIGHLAFAQDTKVDPKNQTTVDSKSSVSLNDPLSLPKDKPIPALISRVITGALGVVGSFALLMFIYGGFMWMLSGGNEKMVEKGKSTLIWAALGLVIIFMSYALVNFVIKTATGS